MLKKPYPKEKSVGLQLHDEYLKLPIRLYSRANGPQNWRSHYFRNLKQKRAVMLALKASRLKQRGRPYSVLLVRNGQRKLDSDNLVVAFKHVRDTIADYFGVSDGDDGIEWKYAQTVVSRKEGYSIVLELRLSK